MVKSLIDVANHINRMIWDRLNNGEELFVNEKFRVHIDAPFTLQQLSTLKVAIDDHLRSNTWTRVMECRLVAYQLDSNGQMAVICTV